MHTEHSGTDVKGGLDPAMLVAVMRRRGWTTRVAMANYLGVSRQVVGRWIDQERQPTGRHVTKLREALTDEEFLLVFPR